MTTTARALILVTALVFATSGRPALAECQPFPKVVLWGEYTHERVKTFVADRMKGDWATYVKQLQGRLKALQLVQARGDKLALNFRNKRIVLEGEKLDAYVRAAEMRVDVAECLAAEAELENLQNFATAAGGAASAPAEAVRSSTSMIASGDLKMKVHSECRGGIATFKVTNEGDAWPKSGTIGIYRTGTDNPERVSTRRIRFTNGQTSTFRVKAARGAVDNLALWVSPSWSERPFTADATVSCG